MNPSFPRADHVGGFRQIPFSSINRNDIARVTALSMPVFTGQTHDFETMNNQNRPRQPPESFPTITDDRNFQQENLHVSLTNFCYLVD